MAYQPLVFGLGSVDGFTGAGFLSVEVAGVEPVVVVFSGLEIDQKILPSLLTITAM